MLEDAIRGEVVEKELDALITRRALKMSPEQERVEELWKASVRKHHDRLRQERLRERLGWHRAQLERHTATFEELMRRHRVGLRLCEEALGLPISEERGDAA